MVKLVLAWMPRSYPSLRNWQIIIKARVAHAPVKMLAGAGAAEGVKRLAAAGAQAYKLGSQPVT